MGFSNPDSDLGIRGLVRSMTGSLPLFWPLEVPDARFGFGGHTSRIPVADSGVRRFARVAGGASPFVWRMRKRRANEQGESKAKSHGIKHKQEAG